MKRSTETRRCPAEIKANLQKHYGGMAERPVDKKASEEFNRPAYQAKVGRMQEDVRLNMMLRLLMDWISSTRRLNHDYHRNGSLSECSKKETC